MDETSDPFEPVDFLLEVFDSPQPLVTAEQAGWWPRGCRECLVALGLLVPAAGASHVVCPACGDRHVEEVTTRQYPDGTVRYFIGCPEAMRVEIGPELLRRWRMDFKR